MRRRTTYRIEVSREGRWWIVEVPELDRRTQASRLDDVETMGRDLIAIILDVEPHSFDVDVHVAGPSAAMETWREADRLDRSAREQAPRAASCSIVALAERSREIPSRAVLRVGYHLEPPLREECREVRS